MSKIVRVVNGDYKVGVRTGGTITLDTGWQQGTSVLTGNAMIHGDRIESSRAEFSILPFVTETVNFATTATNIQIGSNTGTTNVNNNLDVDLDVNIDGSNLTTSVSTFNLLNTTALTVNAFGAATLTNIGATSGTTNIRNNLNVVGDVEIDGGDLTVSTSTFNLANTTATTVNAFGAATTINIGAGTGTGTGTTTINHDVIVQGNLTVNGTTTTVNSSEMSVDDINIILGATAAPTDAVADLGGITLKGTTDKTIVWSLTTGSWTSSENVDLASTKVYKIAGSDVLTSSSVLTLPATVTAFTNATSLDIGASTGTTSINNNVDIDGDLNIDGGNLTTSVTDFNLLNTNAETITAFGSADLVTVGKTGATFSILSTVQFAGDISVGGDISIGGGDMTSQTSSFNLLNIIVTDMFFAGASTNIQIGAATGTTNIKHNLDVDLDLNVDGGDITTSATTFNLLNTTATTVNAFGAATTLEIGAATGTTNINNSLDVNGDLNVDGSNLTVSAATFNLANTTATTINAFGAATSLNVGAATGTTTIKNNVDINGTLNVDGNAITATSTTLSVANTVVTTVNAFGEATAITLGGTTGTTNVRNSLDIDGDLNIDGGDITVGATNLNIANTTATTVNAFGSATTINVGAATGNTTINNNLIVSGDLTVNGTTTTVNSSVLTVDDINIVLGDTASPTDATASTGGITLKGTTDKTFNWILASTAWTSSENLDVASGKVYKIGTTEVLNSSGVLTTPTTVNAFTSATTLELGAATGTTNINNNLDIDGTLLVGGNATFDSLNFIKLPVGTTAQRPGASGQPAVAAGQVRFNSTTVEFEGYDGTAWGPFGGVSMESVALSSTSPYVLDSFNYSLYRTAKYTIQMQNIVSSQLIEILVVHNEIQATYEVVKNAVLGGDCATITVQFNGSNLEVVLTPVFNVTEIQFAKTRIDSTSPVVGALPFIPTNDLQTSSYAIDLNAYLASTIDLNV